LVAHTAVRAGPFAYESHGRDSIPASLQRGSGLVTHLSPELPVRGRYGVTRTGTESLIT
jgi:hypothetical protein